MLRYIVIDYSQTDLCEGNDYTYFVPPPHPPFSPTYTTPSSRPMLARPSRPVTLPPSPLTSPTAPHAPPTTPPPPTLPPPASSLSSLPPLPLYTCQKTLSPAVITCWDCDGDIAKDRQARRGFFSLIFFSSIR